MRKYRKGCRTKNETIINKNEVCKKNSASSSSFPRIPSIPTLEWGIGPSCAILLILPSKSPANVILVHLQKKQRPRQSRPDQEQQQKNGLGFWRAARIRKPSRSLPARLSPRINPPESVSIALHDLRSSPAGLRLSTWIRVRAAEERLL